MNNLFQAAANAVDSSSNGSTISSFQFGVTKCKFKDVKLNEGNENISPNLVFSFVSLEDPKDTHDYVVWPPFGREDSTSEQKAKAQEKFFSVIYMLLNRFEKDVDENGQYNSKNKFMNELRNAGFTEETDAESDVLLFMRPALQAISKIINDSPFVNAELELKVLASVYNNKKQLTTPQSPSYTHFRRVGEKVLTEPLKIGKKEQESYNEYLNFKSPDAVPATSAGQNKEDDAF
ncbi:MAG: hypothetical protein EBU90_01730 [Proteobacteria bacterium]|nr:hypothetical protein [Pseudomonadota bacterium]